MDERARRIVDTAIALAEKDGYSAVRMRDVAAQAEVALGTLYRRFRSKEDILVAALEVEMGALEEQLGLPVQEQAIDRVRNFFGNATRILCARPHLARALLRALTSGEAGATERVAAFHSRINRLITSAMEGRTVAEGSADAGQAHRSEERFAAAFVLQQVWFAALVGWSGGLHDEQTITDQVVVAAELLLRGLATPRPEGSIFN